MLLLVNHLLFMISKLLLFFFFLSLGTEAATFIGPMGWLASLKGHALDLDVFFCHKLVDGFQVNVLRNLNVYPSGILMVRSVWLKEMQTSMMLPGWRGSQTPAARFPRPNVLAVTYNCVSISGLSVPFHCSICLSLR